MTVFFRVKVKIITVIFNQPAILDVLYVFDICRDHSLLQYTKGVVDNHLSLHRMHFATSDSLVLQLEPQGHLV